MSATADLLRAIQGRGIVQDGQQRKLTRQDVADLIGVSVHSVRAWMKPKTAAAHSPMSESMLRLLLHELTAADESGYDWLGLIEREQKRIARRAR